MGQLPGVAEWSSDSQDVTEPQGGHIIHCDTEGGHINTL